MLEGKTYLVLVGSTTIKSAMSELGQMLERHGVPLDDVEIIEWDTNFKAYKELHSLYNVPPLGSTGPYVFKIENKVLKLVARGGKQLKGV
jgi:hypothetical protein